MARIVHMAQSRKSLGEQIDERRREREQRRQERAATDFLFSVGLKPDGRPLGERLSSVTLSLHSNGPWHH